MAPPHDRRPSPAQRAGHPSGPPHLRLWGIAGVRSVGTTRRPSARLDPLRRAGPHGGGEGPPSHPAATGRGGRRPLVSPRGGPARAGGAGVGARRAALGDQPADPHAAGRGRGGGVQREPPQGVRRLPPATRRRHPGRDPGRAPSAGGVQAAVRRRPGTRVLGTGVLGAALPGHLGLPLGGRAGAIGAVPLRPRQPRRHAIGRRRPPSRHVAGRRTVRGRPRAHPLVPLDRRRRRFGGRVVLVRPQQAAARAGAGAPAPGHRVLLRRLRGRPRDGRSRAGALPRPRPPLPRPGPRAPVPPDPLRAAPRDPRALRRAGADPRRAVATSGRRPGGGRLTAELRAPPAPPSATGWGTAAGVAAGALAVTVAGAALAGPGAPLRLVLVPAMGLAGVVAVVAALYRFEAFMLGALVVRSSLDVLGGSGSRATEPATLLGGLFIAAALTWLFVNRARLHRPSPLTWAALAFVAAAALSLPAGVAPGRGLVELVRITGAALLLVMVEQVVRGDPARRRLLLALAASAVLPLAVLASQYVTGTRAAVRGDVSRFAGTFNHPNPFGAYLGLLLITFLAVRATAGGRRRAVFTAGAAACGVGLVATYARGAWVGAVIGVVVVAARVDRRLLARLAVIVVAVLVLVPSVGARATDLGAQRHLSGTAGDSLTWRLDYWGQVLDLADNPVTGIGLTGV